MCSNQFRTGLRYLPLAHPIDLEPSDQQAPEVWTLRCFRYRTDYLLLWHNAHVLRNKIVLLYGSPPKPVVHSEKLTIVT